MAELLIRVVDKVHPTDPAKDQLCFKAGDVIHVAADGWPWGSEELTNPEWRILKLPGVDPALVEDMLEAQTVQQGDVTHMVRKRHKCFDVAHPTVQAYIASGQVITIELSAAQVAFLSRKLTKPVAGIVVVG
jgi:recombinational DNA repair protein (RecF pathway)